MIYRIENNNGELLIRFLVVLVMKEMALICKMDKYIKYSGTEVRKLTFAEIEKYHDERQ